jgi:hypothetical protein
MDIEIWSLLIFIYLGSSRTQDQVVVEQSIEALGHPVILPFQPTAMNEEHCSFFHENNNCQIVLRMGCVPCAFVLELLFWAVQDHIYIGMRLWTWQA